MKRPEATSHRFERLVAQSAYDLLEAIRRDAAARDRLEASPAGGPRILTIDEGKAETLANGFLFGPEGKAEPDSWCVFEELDSSPGVFAWRARLREVEHAAFVGACCRCFLGRDASAEELKQIVARLSEKNLRRLDLVRTLMLADDAHAPGRFLAIAVPSALASAAAPEGANERDFPLLRLGA